MSSGTPLRKSGLVVAAFRHGGGGYLSVRGMAREIGACARSNLSACDGAARNMRLRRENSANARCSMRIASDAEQIACAISDALPRGELPRVRCVSEAPLEERCFRPIIHTAVGGAASRSAHKKAPRKAHVPGGQRTSSPFRERLDAITLACGRTHVGSRGGRATCGRRGVYRSGKRASVPTPAAKGVY